MIKCVAGLGGCRYQKFGTGFESILRPLETGATRECPPGSNRLLSEFAATYGTSPSARTGQGGMGKSVCPCVSRFGTTSELAFTHATHAPVVCR